MRTLKIIGATALMLVVISSFGCRWAGPNNLVDPINREGAVGIGKVPNPGIQLHVFKADSGDVMAQIQSDVNGGNALLRFNRGGATPWDIGYENTDFKFVFRSAPNIDAMTIKSNGNVGIGTTSASDKLEVSGGNIRVTGGGFIDDGTTLTAPDYVFEEDYTLMSLEELHSYILREKRLPNMPGAEKIKKDGLNLSQFQMKLLEKTEELTLYIIAEREQIEALKLKVRELEARLKH